MLLNQKIDLRSRYRENETYNLNLILLHEDVTFEKCEFIKSRLLVGKNKIILIDCKFEV